jgi:formylglycine-generating enzyme required for sulfatase activity
MHLIRVIRGRWARLVLCLLGLFVAVGACALWICCAPLFGLRNTSSPLAALATPQVATTPDDQKTDRDDEKGGPVEISPDVPTVSFPRTVDVDGTIRQPGRGAGTLATVFVFLATRCPISNGSIPELNRLQALMAPSKVEFYGVIADRITTPGEASQHRREYHIAFPVLLDTSGRFRQLLSPTHTPQAVVVDQRGSIVYSGRIDDRYADIGRPKSQIEHRELEDALWDMANGRPPAVAKTQAVGCLLEAAATKVTSSDVTFCRDIAPIVFANCTCCHREGEAAPFPLASYDDVRRHAAQIAAVVEQRVMPPWKAVKGFGQFLNQRSLSDAEIARIASWARNGTPLGDRAALPPLPQFANGWQLGKPDLVIEMPEAFEVPADGPDIYRHFVVPSGISENRLVAAFEFRPGAPSVVHHAFVYFDASGVARRLDAEDPGPGYSRLGSLGFAPSGCLGGWAPGGVPRRLPDGMGRPIPGNADLVLQIHYHPTGKPERDRSKLGLYFAPPDSQRLATEIMVSDMNLEIPPGERRHRFHASYTVPVDTSLLDASPHMHLLGREMKVTATLPDRRVIPLIWIDNWSFYWQEHYIYQQPVCLPAGTRIDVVAWYDNSTANPQNPHVPPRTVRFGEFSDDEMGTCFFQVTAENQHDFLTLDLDATRYYRDLMARYQQAKALGRFTNSARDGKSDSSATNSERGLTNRLGMRFSLVPAGEFWMGADEDERFAPYNQCEQPRHSVQISRPFWMGQHEVTVGQFRQFVAETGYRTAGERSGKGCNSVDVHTSQRAQRPEWIWSAPGFSQTDQHPVVCVSWQDAQEFCRWLSAKEKRTYRLPTEAEWEYACRAGTETLFFFGDRIESLRGAANAGDLALKAVYAAHEGTAAWSDGFSFTAPVGSFPPNAFGLYDMHGNVGEWCQDWFDPDYYARSPAVDPTGPSLPTNWHVIRGGSWYNTPSSCRSTGRHDGIPTAASTTNGFRIVLEADDRPRR